MLVHRSFTTRYNLSTIHSWPWHSCVFNIRRLQYAYDFWPLVTQVHSFVPPFCTSEWTMGVGVL